jgi:hypothetical protein
MGTCIRWVFYDGGVTYFHTCQRCQPRHAVLSSSPHGGDTNCWVSINSVIGRHGSESSDYNIPDQVALYILHAFAHPNTKLSLVLQQQREGLVTYQAELDKQSLYIDREFRENTAEIYCKDLLFIPTRYQSIILEYVSFGL